MLYGRNTHSYHNRMLHINSMFSNFVGIDFRTAEERQAEEAEKAPVQQEEEEDVMTEEERARGEITAAESKRIRSACMQGSRFIPVMELFCPTERMRTKTWALLNKIKAACWTHT